MKKYYYFLCQMVVSAIVCNVQAQYFTKYDWVKSPVLHISEGDEKKSDLVVMLDKHIADVNYESDGTAVVYETVHKIYHVNSAKAIDEVNKGYISQKEIIEELGLKARCITAAGKVIHFNPGTVKSVEDLEGAGPYKIFAIDGVEAGADVEILYTIKKQFNAYGYTYAEGRNPIRHFEAHIISPKNLVYETKSYNGLAAFQKDTTDSNKNHLFVIHQKIRAEKDEEYSSGRANRLAFIYQLSMNTDRKKAKIYTWDVISRELYTAYFQLEKEEIKPIEKILRSAKISGLSTSQEKISALDSYVKTSFEMSPSYGELPFTKAVEAKKMSEANAVKFYIGALKIMNVPFELGVSCDRTDFKLDPKFPSYVYLNEFLMYFPELNKYVSPANIYSRMGFPDPTMLNNNVLFIKEVSLGEATTSSAKTRVLPPNTTKDSYHNFEIKANLDFASSDVKLDVKQLMAGYSAFYIQPVYRYLNDEQKTSIHKNYYLSENIQNVKDFEVSNIKEEDILTKPMVVKYTTLQNDFLENAGNKYLFKVGLLIGPQAELYTQEQRISDVNVTFPHYMERRLEINIPAGFRIKNAADLDINTTCEVNGAVAAVFKSSSEIKNDKIIITVYEEYAVTEYPVASYGSFKAVINAAADFNKKMLIFEKI